MIGFMSAVSFHFSQAPAGVCVSCTSPCLQVIAHRR